MKTETTTELNLIAAGTVFEGKLRTSGSIRIDGKIIGEVSAAQNISVGNGGEIEGNITAKNVTLGGKTKGIVMVQETLVLEAKAVVQGELQAARLVVNEGALFNGKCSMSNKVSPAMGGESKPEPRRPDDR